MRQIHSCLRHSLLGLLFLLAGYILPAQVTYITPSGAGNQSGSNWANAAPGIQLQEMINASAAGNEVWVAAGEYQPASGQSFTMKEGVKIYGGFAATGNPSMADRNYATNITILKGNNATVLNNTLNGLTNAAILDGFTITGGNGANGGGIHNQTSSPLMKNLVIKGNTATNGGGVHLSNGSDGVQLLNSLIIDNTAQTGGGIYINGVTQLGILTNLTISNNTASNGAGISFGSAAIVIRNSIIWGNHLPNNTINNIHWQVQSGNLNFANSLIQGSGGSSNWNSAVGTNQGGNLDTDPLFINVNSGNYSIPAWSPAANAGSTGFFGDAASAKDLSNNARVFGPAIDMGSYENQQAIDASIRYVKQGGTGNGYSWADAHGDLQAMINASAAGNEVWVAAGEYQPASGQSFTMKEGVKIYGGFAATGNPAMADRNYATNITILKGNNATVLNNTLNGLTNAAVLDGFTITGGNAANGGGIHNQTSSPLMRNLVIKGNTATNGGGVHLSNGSDGVQLMNSLIIDNTAQTGGGIFINGVTQLGILTNLTISNNTASNGAGISFGSALIVIRNSIIWGNHLPNNNINNIQWQLQSGSLSFANNLVQGSGGSSNWNVATGTDQGGNLDADPLFVNNAAGNYSIRPWSMAANSGVTAYFADAASAKDLSGNARVFGPSIDMGAYENQQAIDASIRYVKQGGTGNGYSWADAHGDLQNMINASKSGNEVWVASGEYQPASGQSFTMKEGVKIYGGFAATGNPSMADRNHATNITILKGNNASVINNTLNGLTNAAILDGFTITGGNAANGGGIHNQTSSPLMRNLVIKANTATNGGGVHLSNGSDGVQLMNSLIIDNTAQTGGGIFINGVTQLGILTNLTISNNTASNGAGISFGSASVVIRNSIIWGNHLPNNNINNIHWQLQSGTLSFANSLIQGSGGSSNWNIATGTDQGGNLDADPVFVNATGGNYVILPFSPAVNAGNTGFFADAVSARDLSNKPRVYGTAIDMGAYENQVTPVIPGAGGIVYVKKASTGNGSSWSNAAGELADALMNAKYNSAIAQIWTASGTYKPKYSPVDGALGNNVGRDNAFLLVSNVKIYGGFAGTETSLSQRDLSNAANTTIMSGDINNDDTRSENSGGFLTIHNVNDNAYHLLIGAGNLGSAVVDGFTVSGGAAVGGGSILVNTYPIDRDKGAALHNNTNASAAFTNCIFKWNMATNGGAIYNTAGSSPVIENSTIASNWATNGGGVYNSQSTPVFRSSLLKGNQVSGNGGAVYNDRSSSGFINVLMTGNKAPQGGGMYNVQCSPVIDNSTVSGNAGDAIYSTSLASAPLIRNSIVYGNTTGMTGGNGGAFYSLVQGITSTANGNAGDADPTFVNAPSYTTAPFTGGDYKLTACSPAINAANNNFVYTSLPDLAGNDRIYNDRVDMGAYEFAGIPNGSIATASSSGNRTVWAGVTALFSTSCGLLAHIQPAGAAPVNGPVTARVWIDAAPAGSHVKRHYETGIENNPEGATSRLTLYFTEQEFQAFNMLQALKLPVTAVDAAGKARLRVIQRKGNSNNGTGAPGSYPQGGIVIDPADNDIVWNQSMLRWEISFTGTGSAGYFISTEQYQSILLPVKLISFTASLDANNLVQLNWKTSEEINASHFEIERSSDGINYFSIGRVQAAGTNNTITAYTFTDVNPPAGTNYYRLQMTDLDRRYEYSPVRQVKTELLAALKLYPVPAKETVWLNGTGNNRIGSTATIISLAGQTIKQMRITEWPQQIQLTGLAPGVYIIKLSTGEARQLIKR